MIGSLPDDISLGPVRLRVADRARATAWLERILGLHPLEPSEGRSRHGTERGVPLVELREVAGLRPVPRRGLLGLYHYALLLPSRADLARFVVHLDERGERFGSSDHLFSEALYLTDPDGLTVEVYADRPRETWVYKDGEVVGTLDPLDLESLVRAAGETRWQGVPAGTRLGHMHFYVGDLAAAERFYVHGLGFRVSTRVYPGALFAAAGGYHHHVGLNVWAAHQPVAGPADAGLDSWALVIPSEPEHAAIAGRMAAHGAPLERAGTASLARDPWGIAVRITAD